MKALDLHSAEITRISSRRDGSIAFGCETAELPIEAKSAFFELHGKGVRIAIFPLEEHQAELVEVKADKDIKTPSQVLRGTIWKHWKDSNSKLPFRVFYEQQMSAINSGYESKYLSR